MKINGQNNKRRRRPCKYFAVTQCMSRQFCLKNKRNERFSGLALGDDTDLFATGSSAKMALRSNKDRQKNFFMEEKVNHSVKAMMALLVSLCAFTSAHAAEMKDWNFLIFLNGVNNLDSYGSMNINQMEEYGSNDRMNILVQWGSYARPSVDRLYIQKDDDTQKVTSPIEQSLGPADMGSANSLVDFVRWAQENHPARHTFLVIWNHGGGWHRPEFVVKDISWDDRSGNSITTEQLGVAMSQISQILGKKVDIYASDACLMGMIEVADEMASSVDYFLGSQDLEPGDGWPYNTFLNAWQANMDQSPAEVASLLSKHYLAAYSGGIYGNDSVTMSVYDMSKIGPYRDAIRELGTELSMLPPESLSAIRQSATASKYFYNSDYRDALDFVDRLAENSVMLKSSNALRAAHSDFVIANDQNQDQKTHGLSIWIPTDSWDYESYWQRYENLVFNKNTNWGAFITKLLKK